MNDNSPAIHSGADYANHTSRKGTADYNAIASAIEDGLPDRRAKAIVLAIIGLPMLAMLAWAWPGYLGYDHLLTVIWLQAGRPDAVHSLLWGIFAEPIITAGRWGVGAYSVLQVLVLAGLDYGACVRASRALKLSSGWTIALAASIGLWPARVCYSVFVGTDPLWSAIFMWFLSVMLEIAVDGLASMSRTDMWKLAASIVFLVNFRKNGIAVVVVALLALAVVYGRRHWKRVMALVLSLIVGISVYMGLETMAVTKTQTSEAYGPALTMTVKAVMDGAKLDAESQAAIDKWGGLNALEKRWDPLNTDLLRGEVGFKADGAEILTVTWKVCSQKPGSCLDTWFHLMEAYLNPFMSPSDMVYVKAYDGVGYVSDFLNTPLRRFDAACDALDCSATLRWHFAEDNWNWRRQSIADLQNWSLHSEAGHVLRFLFANESAPMWITVIAAGVAALKRRWKILALFYLPMLALVGMYLLISPTALYRFSLYVDWSVPLMVAQCLSSLRGKGNGLTDDPATELEEGPVDC